MFIKEIDMELNLLEARLIEPNEPKFITHLNYIRCLSTLSDSLEAQIKKIRNSDHKSNNKLTKKISIIKLIKKSLDEEFKMAKQNKDIAEVFSIWIPVKSYYLMFNMLLILDYLISPEDNKDFNLTHKEILNRFRNLIKNDVLIFSKQQFNYLYSFKEIEDIKFVKGENLKLEQDFDKTSMLLIKKIFKYKIQEFKRENKIKTFRKRKDKYKLEMHLNKELTGLYEFFYWFRIKANYRDLDFLSNNVGPLQFYEYFESYYNATINFYNCLRNVINKLSLTRFNEEVLK